MSTLNQGLIGVLTNASRRDSSRKATPLLDCISNLQANRKYLHEQGRNDRHTANAIDNPDGIHDPATDNLINVWAPGYTLNMLVSGYPELAQSAGLTKEELAAAITIHNKITAALAKQYKETVARSPTTRIYASLRNLG